MTITITAPLVRAALNRAVARKGVKYRYLDDHDYCRYIWDGKPSCIVGVVLVDLGVDPSVFGGKSSTTGQPVNTIRIGAALPSLPGVEMNNVVLTALANAQDMQDRGGTWGEARDQAFEVLDVATLSP